MLNQVVSAQSFNSHFRSHIRASKNNIYKIGVLRFCKSANVYRWNKTSDPNIAVGYIVATRWRNSPVVNEKGVC